MNPDLIDSFIQEYVDFKNQFAKKGQDRLKEIVKLFFEANPGVNVITWAQYAPYFNDGEPCEFSVHDPTYSNATEEEDINQLYYGQYDGETEGIWATGSWRAKDNLNRVDGVNPEWLEKFEQFIQSAAMEDILRTILGDDVRVVITREGIVANDYSDSHD